MILPPVCLLRYQSVWRLSETRVSRKPGQVPFCDLPRSRTNLPVLLREVLASRRSERKIQL